MTMQEYYEERVRHEMLVTIAGRGTVKCRPGFVFDEDGKVIGGIINNQMIAEQNLNLEDVK
jgi:hypothetical protein